MGMVTYDTYLPTLGRYHMVTIGILYETTYPCAEALRVDFSIIMNVTSYDTLFHTLPLVHL